MKSNININCLSIKDKSETCLLLAGTTGDGQGVKLMTDYTSILGRKYKTTIQNIYPFVFYLRDNVSMRDSFVLNMNSSIWLILSMIEL